MNIDYPIGHEQKLIGNSINPEMLEMNIDLDSSDIYNQSDVTGSYKCLEESNEAHCIKREQQQNCNEDISFVLSAVSVDKSTRSARSNPTRKTPINSSRSAGAKQKSTAQKYNCAPRYMDVAKKNIVEPDERLHYMRVNERICAILSKQHKIELRVPVIQIQL